MPLYRTQVSLANVTSIPEDRVTNTWWTIADNVAALQNFVTALVTFYQSVDAEFSSVVATTGHDIKSYDMADPEPRRPVNWDTSMTLAPGTTRLPPELAICLSFQAPPQSGVEQARRRGRVYLGPLRVAAIDSAGNIATAAATTVRNAAQTLLDSSDAIGTWSWAVYSTVDQTAITVTSGWVDQAVDIQRRRGLASPSRLTFEL